MRTFEYEGAPGQVSLDTLILEDDDGRTKLTSISVFQTPEARDGMLEAGMEKGVNERLREFGRAARRELAAGPARPAEQIAASLSCRAMSSGDQSSKGERFRALHEGEPFVIPNPWDIGSARVFEALGFKALATTSAGFAYTLGRLDGGVTLDEVIDHVSALAAATSLPISVDLENGYGADPEQAALAITRAAEAGAVGGSIEDYDPEGRIYEIEHATERIVAAREAADALDFPFTLTGRAENHLRGNPDLDDTIARLQAYERAGADVIYAPGLYEAVQISAVRDATSKPQNVLALPNFTRRRDRRGRRSASERRQHADLGGRRRDGERGPADTRLGRSVA